MSTAYHDRFAAELQTALPENFVIFSDKTLTTASYGTASLIGFTPLPGDKRRPVDKADVTNWITSRTANLRRDMVHFTPEAKKAANALLNALPQIA